MPLPKNKPSAHDALTALAQLIHYKHDGEIVLKMSDIGDGLYLHGEWVILTDDEDEDTGVLGIKFNTTPRDIDKTVSDLSTLSDDAVKH